MVSDDARRAVTGWLVRAVFGACSSCAIVFAAASTLDPISGWANVGWHLVASVARVCISDPALVAWGLAAISPIVCWLVDGGQS